MVNQSCHQMYIDAASCRIINDQSRRLVLALALTLALTLALQKTLDFP